MLVKRAHAHCIFAALLAVALAGCSGQKDAARSLIAEIAESLSAAEPEAVRYIPGELKDIEARLADLRVGFAKGDYAGVNAAAPAVLVAAQSLATEAAAKKDQILKAKNDAWSALASVLPDEVTALQNRVEHLGGKKLLRKPAQGADAEAARAAVIDIASRWSKAQAAFAGGNLDEAVGIASDVKSKVDALSVTLNSDKAQPSSAT